MDIYGQDWQTNGQQQSLGGINLENTIKNEG